MDVPHARIHTPFRRRNRRRSVLLTPYYGHMHIMIPHCQVRHSFAYQLWLINQLTPLFCVKRRHFYSLFRVPATRFLYLRWLFLWLIIIFIITLCASRIQPPHPVYYNRAHNTQSMNVLISLAVWCAIVRPEISGGIILLCAAKVKNQFINLD